jgi:hypothetical protein
VHHVEALQRRQRRAEDRKTATRVIEDFHRAGEFTGRRVRIGRNQARAGPHEHFGQLAQGQPRLPFDSVGIDLFAQQFPLLFRSTDDLQRHVRIASCLDNGGQSVPIADRSAIDEGSVRRADTFGQRRRAGVRHNRDIHGQGEPGVQRHGKGHAGGDEDMGRVQDLTFHFMEHFLTRGVLRRLRINAVGLVGVGDLRL